MLANRVVVTGVGVVSPLGLDAGSTWKNLLGGKSGVDQITSFDAEGYGTTIAAEVKDFDPDPIVGRKQARRMDRFVQLGAAAALEAVVPKRAEPASRLRAAHRAQPWHGMA